MADYDNTRRRLEKIRKTFEHLHEQNAQLVKKNDKLLEMVASLQAHAEARERVLKSVSEKQIST